MISLRLRLLCIIPAFFAFSVAACARCVNEVLGEATSSTTGWKAVTFLRTCGAMSSYTAGLTIIPANEKLPSDIANVLAFGDTTAPGTDGRILKSIHATWVAKDTLLVTYDARAQVGLQVTVFRGVHVRYSLESETSKQR